ncbi:MAG: helix-turn-helix domain-containing protein [Bacteroidota bacterium]
MIRILFFIQIIGLIQAFFIAFLIFRNRVFAHRPNQYFAYFLILIAIIGLDSRLHIYYNTLDNWAELFFDIVGDDIPWVMIVYIPLFKFFLLSSYNEQRSVIIWPFYLPFVSFLLINLIIDLDLELGLTTVPFFTNHRLLFYLLEDFISIPLFSGLHLFVFFKVLHTSTNPWLKKLWWYCTALIITWAIHIIDQSFFNDPFLANLEMILWTGIMFFVYWLMYSGLFEFNLAKNREEIRAKLTSAQNHSSPTRPGLSAKSKAYFDQLMEYMVIDKAYRNPDLSRELVAKELGISMSYLTQLIREYAEASFTGFINEFRVEEVKQMLSDHSFDTYDSLSIGLEAGFKSKSAYYTTFKNFTGKTPSQFKKMLS